MAVLWVVATCSLVEFYRRFRHACCRHHQRDDLVMEETGMSETSVNVYHTTRCSNPGDGHLQSRESSPF
jgi:hypothetical protein